MNVFDIVGPVMVGPSSSHTAGAARIGFIAGLLLGVPAARADIKLYGSFYKTYRGHGTDKAIVAGILGMKPDNPKLRDSLEIAETKNLLITISQANLENAHPNTAVITLYDADGKSVSIQGASVGGGNVEITRINNQPVSFTGRYVTLVVIHRDVPGTIAKVTEKVSAKGVNISNFRLARNQKGGTAVMTIEVDGTLDREVNDSIMKLPNILHSTLIMPN